MRFFPVFALLLLIGRQPATAQSTNFPADSGQKSQVNTIASLLPQVAPQSPNVAALGRFGEHPVSLYTGLPTIEVPVYDIVAGALRVPVKLAYHAGGIRVTDQASWVGLGWALQAGGVISRNIVGKPDEDGILNTPLNTNINISESNNTICSQSFSDLIAYVDNVRDRGYDIFSFSLPGGKSGKFILIPDAASSSQATTMPYSRIRIAFTRTAIGAPGSASYISSFTLTDEDGTQYLFDQREGMSSTSGGTNQQYTSNWQLSSIRGLGPQDEVRFVYAATPEQVTTNDISYSDTVVDDLTGGGCSAPAQWQGPVSASLENIATTQLLQEIQFPAGKLTFSTATRTDLVGVKLLDKIGLWGWNTTSNVYSLIKTFDLLQDYFTPASGSSFAPLRLNGVRLLDGANNSVGQYSFLYNLNTALPGPLSVSRDLWGYHNAKTNRAVAPYNNQFTLAPRQVVTLNTSSGPTTLTIGGADRSVDETAMQAWILTQMAYPTGGYSRFYYEANRYLDGTVQLAGGLRISRIETQASGDAPLQTKTYRYGVNENGYGRAGSFYANNNSLRQGFWESTYRTYNAGGNCSYRSRVYGSSYSAGLNPYDGSPVTYSEVREYDGTTSVNNGYTIYRFKDSPTDNLKVLGSNPNRNFVESYYWNRGQTLEKLVYTTGQSLVSRTVNTYRDDYAPVSIANIGILTAHAGLYPDGRSYFQTACGVLAEEFRSPVYYSWISGLVRLIRSETYTYPSVAVSGYTYRKEETDYSPSFFMPTETRTFAEGNIVVGTRLSYPQNFTRAIPNNADPELLGICTMQERNAYLPVETINFRQESPTAEKYYKAGKLTTYNSLTFNNLPTVLPRQIYLPETDFNNKVYVPGSTTSPYQSSAEWYNSPTAIAGQFPVDRLWQTRLTMSSYDGAGNLTSYSLAAGPVTNLTYQILSPAGGVPFSIVLSETKNAGQPSAQAMTFTYAIPLLGVSETFTPTGVKTSYEYDSFGRLGRIKDKDGNILKAFTYHYNTETPAN